MNYLSVCSGIEAATVAWHNLGWNPLGFSEIEKFPSEVLAHHYPNTPNLGDMTKYKEWDFGTSRLDLLVGGTPCQSFSVAGLRKGLEDPRGNLALTYVGILDKFRPKWCVWENVPGVLSSNRGRDFGAFLGALGELGYGWSYRVLDAKHFGVPQRRRRVFVVGCLGNWESAAKVLFEPESLRWDIKKRRSKGKEVAATITARFGNSRNNHEELAPIWPAKTASTLNASFGNKLGLENQHINSGAPLFVPAYVESSFGQYREDVIAGTSKASGGSLGGGSETFITLFEPRSADGVPRIHGNICPTLNTMQGGQRHPCIALAKNTIGRKPLNGGNGDGFTENGPMYTLNATGVHGVNHEMLVRRLTEVECERLQGFPDNYTNIKENCPDGPRYKALGNSMAVPVMKWIGERIANV